MKVTHLGEDYATVLVGKREFDVSLGLGKAIMAQNKLNLKRLNKIDAFACMAVEDNDNGEAQELEIAYKYLLNQFV